MSRGDALLDAGQFLDSGERIRMSVTQYSPPTVDNALLKGEGAIAVSGRELNRSKISHRRKRLGVVFAQDSLADLEKRRLCSSEAWARSFCALSVVARFDIDTRVSGCSSPISRRRTPKTDS